jgi:hypothetical protein
MYGLLCIFSKYTAWKYKKLDIIIVQWNLYCLMLKFNIYHIRRKKIKIYNNIFLLLKYNNNNKNYLKLQYTV